MYLLELVERGQVADNTVGYPPAPLVFGYADFCVARAVGLEVVTFALLDDTDTLGWFVCLERGGRYDALPDRMIGFLRADGVETVDLDKVYRVLRRELGGTFRVNLPAQELSGPYVGSHKGHVQRYHAYNTFVMRAANSEQAWLEVERVGRQGVRKAQRGGVEVSVGCDGSSLMQYLGLHIAKSNRLGSPAMSRADLTLLRTIFGSGLGLAVARLESRPIAAVLYCVVDDYAILIDNASEPEQWSLNPNNLVVFEAVRAAIEAGATVVDYGFGALDDEGGARFKKHLGAREVAVYSITAG